MARQWNPGPRSQWTVIDGYGARRRGGAVALVLLGAVWVGVAVGFYEARRTAPAGVAAEADRAEQRSSAIEWDAVQAPPKSAVSGEDEAWAQRAGRRDSPSTLRPGSGQAGSGRAEGGSGGVRVAFGSCKWGGGTNCVVDGDTFYIGGAKVRIAGIDTPETHDYRCAGELALGERATDMLRQMLNSGAVTMTSIDRDRDVYGRLLRNVAVNGADVGEAMVSAGVAREYAGGRRAWC